VMLWIEREREREREELIPKTGKYCIV